MDKRLLEKAYRKLKSHIFYDNSTLRLKEQVAIFENSDVEVQLDELCSRFNEDPMFLFRELADNISIECYPKAFETNNDSVVTNSNDVYGSYEIIKTSYFIRMPIEAHILGSAWILLAGKYLDRNLYQHTYGNRLREPYDENLEKITNTPYMFKPYFKSYETWRDHAIDRAQSMLNKGDDVLIVSLDLASYYYSANIDFKSLSQDVEQSIDNFVDLNLDAIRKLNQFVQIIFEEYSKRFIFTKGKRTIIPIGFLPSNIIANWYLNDFDSQILQELKPIYYGRYVDDMIMVVDASAYSKRQGEFDTIDVMDDLFTLSGFSKKNILKRIDSKSSKDSSYYVLSRTKYKELKIQNSKIRIFHLVANGSQAILDNFKAEIRKVSSEFRFLQEEGVLNCNFEEAVYKLKYEDTINKFRGVRAVEIDKFELSKYLAKINFITKSDDMTKNTATSQNILKAFAGTNAVKYYLFWEKVFTYYLLQGDCESIVDFYIRVAESIDKLSASEKALDGNGQDDKSLIDYQLSDMSEIEVIIRTLHYRLYLSLALTISLKWSEETKGLIKLIFHKFLSLEKKSNHLICIMMTSKKFELSDTDFYLMMHSAVKKFIKSNLINHQMVNTPLRNYTICIDEHDEYNFLKFTNPCIKERNKCEFGCFDEMKNRYNPRFVHIHEAFIFYYAQSVLNGKVIEGTAYFDQIFMDVFLKLNYPNVGSRELESVLVQNNSYYKISVKDPCSGYQINEIVVGNEKYDKIKIAVGNVRVNNKDIEDSIRGLNTTHPRRLEDLSAVINEATRQNVKLLVLPECYVPFHWLGIIAEQSRKHGILIIVGLEHMTFSCVENGLKNRKAFNYIATFLPYQVGGLQYVLPKLRLKTSYSPAEMKMIQSYGYQYIEGKEFDIFEWNGIRIAPYYCFEIADIKARGMFRSEVDIITISEYNKDVNYFSNIVESLSRDVHCICVQANTSQYGDSRIVQPSRTETMNILRVKGGDNQFIMTAEVSIKELRQFQALDYIVQEEKKNIYKQTPPKFERDKVKKRLGYKV